MAEKEDREEADAKEKRIKRWRRTGAFFDSTPDLRWLFVKLAIANGGEIYFSDEDRLREFVAGPIWAEIYGGRDDLDELLQQGAALVENSKFQCTALRDFLAKRIIACLIPEAKEQKRSSIWQVVAAIAVISAFALIGWWGLLVLGFVAWSEVERLRFNERLRAANQEAKQIYSEVSLGGYDEHVVVRRLEALEKRYVTIPSVLYALLRLPRHNVEAEISAVFNALDLEKKKAIWQQWKAFLDFMLKNDDGDAERKARDVLENHRAKIFEPIRDAINELSDHFKDEPRIVFTSKSGEQLPSTYSIDIRENAKQQYYIYVRCEKHSLESEEFSYPMRVIRNPNVFSEWLFFYPGDEQKIVSIIGALLLDYQRRGELTVEDVKEIVQRHQNMRPPEQRPNEDNILDGEAKEVMRIKMICEVAHGSAETVREAAGDAEWLDHERRRYEKHRAMALDAAKAITDEFYRDAGVHFIIDFCMIAGDGDEAKTLFRSVRTDTIRDKILEAHPTLR